MLPANKKATIQDVSDPKTAAKIIETLQSEGHLDDYHILILESAYRLRLNNLTHFRYVTGWGSSTLWVDGDNANAGHLTVSAYGSLS